MKKLALVFLSLAASSLVVACGQTRVGAIGEAEDAATAVGEHDPDDPYGHCFYDPVLDPDDTTASLGYAEASAGEHGCTGYSEGGYSGQETCVMHAIPVHACETDADCPSPISGTSQVVCISHACILPCNDGEGCPDGQICEDGWYHYASGAVAPTPKLCMTVFEFACPTSEDEI